MFDLYQLITDRVIASLEAGVAPWHRPWSVSGEGCYSYTTGKPYSVLNTLLLEGKSGDYLTYNAAVKAGGHVRKGEKSHVVVFWKMLENVDKDTGEVKLIPFLRSFNVFHIDQCEGLTPKHVVTCEHYDTKPDAHADSVIDGYIKRSGVKLEVSRSNDAYYSPSHDRICVPELSQYAQTEEYYSTLFHEAVHSTGHISRLNRLTDPGSMFSSSYSKEELVAELGSAFIMNSIGLETPDTFANSAAYLKGWLKVLKSDKRFIISAAGHAEKAVAMILGKDGTDNGEE